jgi:hypothetical protein
MALAAALAAAGSGGGGGGDFGDGGAGDGGIDESDSTKAKNASDLAKATNNASKSTASAAKATTTAAKATTTAAKTTATVTKNTGSNTIPKSSMPFGGSIKPTGSNTIPKSSMPFGGASIVKSTGSNTVPKASMPSIKLPAPKSTGSNTIPKSSMPFGGASIIPKKKMYGGFIRKMAAGGFVPGVGMTDKVPALLTPGEFVVNKRSAGAFAPFLSALNDAKYPSMIGREMNSPVYSVSAPNNTFAMPTNSVSSSINDNSNTVYNYNVGITVGGTNASPDRIAKAVMNEIKYIDAQRIRNQRA